MPISMMFWRVTFGRYTSSIGYGRRKCRPGRFLAARGSQVQDDAEFIGTNPEGEGIEPYDRREYDGHQEDKTCRKGLSHRAWLA
jgi:hypothetical protein